MNLRTKLVLGVITTLLTVSLFLNWSAQQTIHGFAANVQGNFMDGWASISQANENFDRGNKTVASLDAYRGIGYLQASSGGMSQLGVHGVFGLAMFMDRAMPSLLDNTSPGENTDSDSTKQHYQQVIQVFIDNFKPFGSVQFGSIDNHQLQQAINRVYQAMTPQEQKQFQGWGL